MVVDEFDSGRTGGSPHEAQTPLAVDAQRVLALAVALQGFEVVRWRHPQIIKPTSGIKLGHLSKGTFRQVWREAPGFAFGPESLGAAAGETLDHVRNPIA